MRVKSFNVTTQMKAAEQYQPVGPFIQLSKRILARSSKSVDRILTFEHSNKSF